MPLELRQVSLSFAGQPILSNYSFLFPDHSTIALMGPSGCGKTTLLRLLAGLEVPESGTVDIPPTTRLSFVFQEDRLLPALTARANIAAVLEYSESAGRILADSWLDRIGLAEDANKYPAQLSGGMKRRVAIARALAFGGDVLLLDEPFKGLDTETREHMQDMVFSGFDARRRTNIFVTHDMEEALQYASSIVLLDGPPLYVKETVDINIPLDRRRDSEETLIWYRDFIRRKM